MKILVVPTIREKNIKEFLDSWAPLKDWDKIIVVEDNPTKTFQLPSDVIHYSWEEIKADLKKNNWIISKRDSAIRSFGFLKAYEMGASYIFSLDDDCFPKKNGFCTEHIDKLENQQKWTDSVINFRTRGKPYFNLGKLNNVMINHGLWCGIPDLDSIQSLNNLIADFNPDKINRIIPKSQYFPFCGMNISFKRDAAPLMYFALMGQESPYKRFDDIWCGIIMKKICDHLDWHVSCGEPFIKHLRASDVMTNLQKEAPGIAFNESFWETIDNIKLKEKTAALCMKEIGEQLMLENNDYLKKYGNAIEIWSSYFVKT